MSEATFGARPGAPAAPISPPGELDPSVQALLRCVYGVFGREGEWPIQFFVESELEGKIDRDLDSLLEQAPPGLLAVQLPSRNETPIVLRIAALIHCAGAGDDVSLFLWLLRWCVTRQKEFRPTRPTAVEELKVSARELAADLKADGYELSALDARKAHAFLISERIHSGLGGDPDDWTLTLSRKVLKPYFQVATLEDYLAVVAAAERPPAPPPEDPGRPATEAPGAAVTKDGSAVGGVTRGGHGLNVDDLHQAAGAACGRLFAGGHYSEGVLAATKAMCRVIRARSGLKISDDHTLVGRALGERSRRSGSRTSTRTRGVTSNAGRCFSPRASSRDCAIRSPTRRSNPAVRKRWRWSA